MIRTDISPEPFVTSEALAGIGCTRGTFPPPRVIVPEVIEVSSREENDSEDDLVELRELSSSRFSSDSKLQETTIDIVHRIRNHGNRPRVGESSRAPPLGCVPS